jgi:hypothetical protein
MNIYRVKKPLVSLARVRDAQQVDILALEAPVASWDGIERFEQLLGLEVDPGCLPDNDAGPIGSLTSLNALTLMFESLPAGLAGMGALRGLKHLQLWDEGRVSTLPTTFEWLEGLNALELLFIVNNADSGVVTPSLAVLTTLQRLETLHLSRVIPREGPALFATGFPALRKLSCTTTPDFGVEAILASRPDLILSWTGLVDAAIGSTILEDDDGRFSVYLDLCSAVDGAEGNHEATEVMQVRLAAAEPELAARLGWDPEADGVAVLAERREDLEQFLRFVDAQ